MDSRHTWRATMRSFDIRFVASCWTNHSVADELRRTDAHMSLRLIRILLFSWCQHGSAFIPYHVWTASGDLRCGRDSFIHNCHQMSSGSVQAVDPAMCRFVMTAWFKNCLFALRNTLIARFMGPTWAPSGADRTQVGPCWPPEPCYLGYSVLLQKASYYRSKTMWTTGRGKPATMEKWW